MNSCILMAEIIQDPQLRYTPDTQTPIAEMLVQFPGLRDDEPAATLKVVGWGNLAQEIQENYHQGDRVVIEGRLGMITFDRPEGFKEKRAELTVQRIHRLGTGADAGIVSSTASATAATTTGNAAPRSTSPAAKPAAASKPAPARAASSRSGATESKPPAYQTAADNDVPDYDDIPF